LIDDDSTIRELYVEILKGEGFEVETAQDGEEGLTKIKQGGWNLILLDVMMPKIDGLGVLTKLEETNKKPDAPIILLTNLAHDPAIAKAIQKGAKTCLIKADLNPNEFVAKISQFVT